jgi:hypothetical protein
MEGELIIVSIISLIGTIIIATMFNANWFKKENFKLQKQNILAENRIKFKRLEKEMGLRDKAPAMDYSALLPLAEKFLKPAESAEDWVDESPDGVTGALLDYAAAHPDIVQSLAKGFLDKSKQNQGGNETQFL